MKPATSIAAEQSFAPAQYNLGVMYDNGDGVPQDEVEAMRWYRLAADQGFAAALIRKRGLYARLAKTQDLESETAA